jgi:glycosyltransferase involved in cell wall biosynthesis
MPLMKLPLSVYMVSGAEAGRIGAALESVAGWAGEIVVVLNQDVHDGTEEIARQHGAVLHREPWKGFVAQKNSAIDRTTLPWSLNLDADERVTPSLRAEIERVVTSSTEGPLVYSFPRCTHFLGRWIRHGDWYPDRVTRLARREAARWAGDEPHATLEHRGTVGRLRSDLLHFSNLSVDSQLAKLGPYSEAFAASAAASGRRTSWLDLAVRPWWRFLRCYFLRLGFLDGIPGYQIAWCSAFQVTVRYIKLHEYFRQEPQARSTDR